MAVERSMEKGEISIPKIPVNTKEKNEFDEKVEEIANSVRLDCRIYDGVQATQKVIGSHSQIVNVRKKENKDPQLCYQMMITCVHGVSEKMAKAIMKKYKTMPQLIMAYEKCKTEKEKMNLLKDVETNTFTPKGKRRKVGPMKSSQVYKALYAILEDDEDENNEDEDVTD